MSDDPEPQFEVSTCLFEQAICRLKPIYKTLRSTVHAIEETSYALEERQQISSGAPFYLGCPFRPEDQLADFKEWLLNSEKNLIKESNSA